MNDTLPLTPEDFTPEWLSQALARRYPGVAVTHVELSKVIHGTASKILLTLEYNAAGRQQGLPSRLCAKGGFRDGEQRALLADSYRKEMRFYRDLAPRLPSNLELAHCYFADENEAQHQAIVLLEDLTDRQVRFGRSTEPIDVATAHRTIEWLAGLHAFTHADPQTATLDAYPSVIAPVIAQLLQPPIWDLCINRPLADVVPAKLRDGRQMHRAFASMWEKAADTLQCGIHGDTHLGNMYFLPDGTPSFLDWQCQMRSPALDDVTYFLVGALTIDDRRRHERELLRHYLDCLAAKGVPAPTFDAAWTTYRQQLFHGLMFVATPPQMQPDDVVAAFVERYCTAVDDLDGLAAIGM